MIGVIFQFGADIVEVKVENNNVFFRNSDSLNFADIDGLQLNKAGVIKEFPDLKDDYEWQRKARERFKEKIRSFDTEEKRMRYIMDDLIKFGYRPLYLQKAGFRPQRL